MGCSSRTRAEGAAKQLEFHVDHIRDERTPDDILYELLLKSGFPLTTPVEKQTLAGKTVYSVAGGALVICLERELTLELIRAIADAEAGARRLPGRRLCRQRPAQGQRRADLQDQRRHQLQDGVRSPAMKLQFDANQPFQLDAVAAVTDLFDGQPQGAPEYTVIDLGNWDERTVRRPGPNRTGRRQQSCSWPRTN